MRIVKTKRKIRKLATAPSTLVLRITSWFFLFCFFNATRNDNEIRNGRERMIQKYQKRYKSFHQNICQSIFSSYFSVYIAFQGAFFSFIEKTIFLFTFNVLSFFFLFFVPAIGCAMFLNKIATNHAPTP